MEKIELTEDIKKLLDDGKIEYELISDEELKKNFEENYIKEEINKLNENLNQKVEKIESNYKDILDKFKEGVKKPEKEEIPEFVSKFRNK